jgi:hypothetical protein
VTEIKKRQQAPGILQASLMLSAVVVMPFKIYVDRLVNALSAPVAGMIFDVIGARRLYGFATTGYAIGLLSLLLTRPLLEQ